MKAELKSLTSVDIDELTYWPDDEEMFGFNVDAAIGPDTDISLVLSRNCAAPLTAYYAQKENDNGNETYRRI